MSRSVVWIEGVDFFDTLYDTEKLSIIRGASRALEEMPGVARDILEKAGLAPRHIVAGASQAAFLVSGDSDAAERALAEIMDRLTTQGLEPDSVKRVTEDFSAQLAEHAPFAHLKFQGAAVAVVGDEIGPALEKAHGRVRVTQMRDPGVRRAFAPKDFGNGKRICEFDRVRPVECAVDGPDPKRVKDFETRYLSRSSAARWYFGRALRQRLYEKARGTRRLAETAFCDDFQEMIATPHPRVRRHGEEEDLPLSVGGKIAVFAADGDGFGDLLARLVKAMGGDEIGRACLTIAIERRMHELMDGLAGALFAMSYDPDEAEAAAALLGKENSSASATKKQRVLGIDRLHRFETLLFGGEDVAFVVPAWLGWWLALRFYSITNGWAVEPRDVAEAGGTAPAGFDPTHFAMRFSAGLVFCSCKTPIRAAKKLAEDLCHLAKGSGKGGLEVEILESVEPPFDGVESLRTRLLDEEWGEARETPNGTETTSRLTIPREEIAGVYRKLHGLWAVAEPFPASQAHRALRSARDVAKPGRVEAADAARKGLEDYFKKAGAGKGFSLEDFQVLPRPDKYEGFGLQLHFALQQRDYIRGAGAWGDRAAGLP